MRPHIREFVRACAAHLPLNGTVVEVGAKRVASQDKLANLRPLFPNHRFVGCDMDSGPGVDRLENLEGLTFADGEVGVFVLCDTLEHVRDLDKACTELARCLDSRSGILLATSVMLFPVHGYPNDYWRFTPEGFRHLGRHFEWSATFYGGDPQFPHTVALVAGHGEPSEAAIQQLAQALRDLPPAPHYADAKSEQMFAALGTLLRQARREAGYEERPVRGEIANFALPGWVLARGGWLRAKLPELGAAEWLEVVADGQVVQAVPRAQWNVLVDREFASDFETAFQFDPPAGVANQVAQLELYLVDPSGEKRLAARTALGTLLAQADPRAGMTLHALDCREAVVDAQTGNPAADALVRTLRARGERIVVDLGCGFRKAGNIGIDATAANTEADLICLLGFEPLPFKDGMVDEVVCRDFLEHLPKAVYLESKRRLHYPVMQLIDEVWRVLKPGGVFRSWTPMYPHPEVFQDPTHLSAWTIKSMDYFCGIYAGAKKIYGIQANFEKIEVKEEGFYLFAELRKPQSKGAGES